jgi:hypothetical protein
VGLKKSVNDAIVRATGYRFQRALPPAAPQPPRPGDRLLERPAFILCSVRSGSTLLRVLLSSHSQIHCPHEMHLRHVGVSVDAAYAQKALTEVGLDPRHLQYLLWDRLLQRELASSGKRLLVNKTPNDTFVADRIRECWPDARFIHLQRHPAAIARSREALRPQDTPERNATIVARYCNAVEQARLTHGGITVRYEDLAADPAAVTRRVCHFLGVPWEERMLDYGNFAHGHFKAGLGDWSEKIKSGRVQAPEPPPPADEIPPELVDLCRAWGYLEQEPVPQASQSSTMSLNVDTRAEPPAL